ncbi:unnamed protein product [Rotaria sordida]|uniref:Helix-turn-helix domain-containing protein n=1 Tax=Rotaria sordida TaxID=392033 RepID=A0A814S347_9BILA|nr:unnamed protein product [Rotaria sordida]CAF1372117.1 unnamed protein product [Rotaria sordida]
MTTNQTIDEIKIELEKAANKDINIKIHYEINTSVDFLDIAIISEHDQLKTCLYHKPTAEPYILPYTSDHPRHIHRNIPYAALLRAAHICSDVQDFNTECIRIDMSLLLNSYPPICITKQIYRFFQLNNVMPVLNQLNDPVYHRLHQKLLYQPARREKQLHLMTQDSIRSPTVLQQKICYPNIIYPRYLFDSSTSINFRTKFNKWWRTYYAYNGSTLKNVKVRLVPSTNSILETFFIHKKPSKAC